MLNLSNTYFTEDSSVNCVFGNLPITSSINYTKSSCLLNPNAKTFIPHILSSKNTEGNNQIITGVIPHIDYSNNYSFLLDLDSASPIARNFSTPKRSELCGMNGDTITSTCKKRYITHKNLFSTPGLLDSNTPVNINLYGLMGESMQLFSYFKYFCLVLSMCLYTCIYTHFLQTGSMHDNVYNDISYTNDNSSHLSNACCSDEISSLESTIVNSLEFSEVNINDKSDHLNILKSLRVSNVNRLIIGHLNINSLRNKFESLKLIMKGNIDILVITESKLDDSFPVYQFIIDGYAPPFRADKNKNSGGVIIYVREDPYQL